LTASAGSRRGVKACRPFDRRRLTGAPVFERPPVQAGCLSMDPTSLRGCPFSLAWLVEIRSVTPAVVRWRGGARILNVESRCKSPPSATPRSSQILCFGCKAGVESLPFNRNRLSSLLLRCVGCGRAAASSAARVRTPKVFSLRDCIACSSIKEFNIRDFSLPGEFIVLLLVVLFLHL
jgi:hypothetical protein